MYSLFIGIDVSKNHIDVSYTIDGLAQYLGQYENTVVGFVGLFCDLRDYNSQISEWIFCFENTGCYSKSLVYYLSENNIAYKEENPIVLKRSIGLKRGKTDKADSKSICRYVFEKKDCIQVDTSPNKPIIQLKKLLKRRKLIQRKKLDLEVSYKEQKNILDDDLKVLFGQQNEDIVALFDQNIKQIEDQIKVVISSHQSLKINDRLLKSIIGIGPIGSAMLIAYTENFKSFNDARKFASYVGIAPFTNRSGKYTGKDRVSHLANKTVKTILSNCVQSTIRHDPQLRSYYFKKINEGKKSGSVMNAVKNKLIHRAFAVIQRQTPYVKLAYI